jgi:hypothetical protein
MEPKKYWWMHYSIIKDGELVGEAQVVTDIHPFSAMKTTYLLRSWQLISAEEYNLWNDLNNKQ